MYYFITLHNWKDDIDEERLLKCIEKYPHILTYELPNVNPHYHIILETDKTTNYLSQMLRQKFQTLPKQVSCKRVRQLEKAISYAIKEGDIKSNTLITDPMEFENIKIKSRAVHTEVLNVKALKASTFTQHCIDTFESQGSWVPDESGRMIDHILYELDKKAKGFDEFIVKRIYLAMKNRYYGETVRKRMKENAWNW